MTLERYQRYKQRHNAPEPHCKIGEVTDRMADLFHWAKDELDACDCGAQHHEIVLRMAMKLRTMLPSAPTAESISAMFKLLEITDCEVRAIEQRKQR